MKFVEPLRRELANALQDRLRRRTCQKAVGKSATGTGGKSPRTGQRDESGNMQAQQAA